jgi:hypothetical protein
VIGYTAAEFATAGRYLLPVLLAWFATMMTVFFAPDEFEEILDFSASPSS